MRHLLGRSQEIIILQAMAAGALAGQVQAVVISGPAGIGKTTLVEHLTRTSLREFTVLRSAGIAAESARPYSALNRLTASNEGMRESHLLDRTRFEEDSSAIAAGRALLQAVDSWGQTPLLLFLDNAHDMDEHSLRAFGFFLLRLPNSRVLAVVNTEQPDRTCRILGMDRTTPGFRHIALTGLDAAEVREFVRASGYNAMPESRLSSLVRWSDGNPLYLKAVLGHLAASPPGTLPRMEVSHSLATAVAKWAASFPEPGRQALRILAVLQTPSTLPLLNQISGQPVGVDDIETLVQGGAVRWREQAGGPLVELAHPGQQDALYVGISYPDRQDIHRRIARVLAPPDKWRHQIAATDTYDGPLATQLSQAAEQERHEGHLSLAAEYALGAARVAPDGADRQAALLKGVRLLVVSGEVNAALGYHDAVLHTPAGPSRSEALGLLSAAGARGAAASRYLQLAKEGFESQGMTGSAAAAAAELAVMQNYLAQGADACTSARFALAHSTDALVVGLARFALAFGTALTQGIAAGLQELDFLPADPARVPAHSMEALMCRGMFRGLTGDMRGGLADLGVTLSHRVVGPVPESNGTALVHCAWTHYLLGEWREARRKLSLAFDVVNGYGRGIDFGILHGLSAVLYASVGKIDEARADLRESRELSKNTDYGAPMFHTAISQAVVEFIVGDHQKVVEILTASQSEVSNEPRVLLYGPWFLPLFGISFARLGRTEEARAALLALQSIGVNGPMPAMTSLWLEGNIHAAEGNRDAAVVAYRSALAVHGPGGNPVLHRALVRRDLGEQLLRAGDAENARTELLAAARSFSGLEAETLLSSCEDLLQATGSRDVGRPDAVWSVLTAREKDIVELVGRGWTNREIADDLFISTKTVEYHLRNIFAKCDFPNRRGIRDWYQARQSS